MRKVSGFTLVELLVVVAIIIILSTVGLTIYTDSQKNARDAKRKQDITAFADALEVRYNNGVYPTAVGTDWFVGAEPTDPKNTGEFVYYKNLPGSSYRVCAKMEIGSGGNYNCPTWTTSKTCDSDGAKADNGGYFCFTNRQ